MPSGLDLQRVTVRIFNHFDGPNFVNGLAKQTGTYTILSETRAMLVFQGGFNSDITYVQIVEGEGFGLDANGRYTGTVHSYVGFEQGAPQNRWTFENLNTSLDRLNTLASDPEVTFEDLLLIPLEYEFVGAQFDDVFITGSFDDIAYGFAGNDNFDGLGGDDRLFGHSGSDILTGEDGADFLSGGRDDDLVFGGDGADTILGGHGADVLNGGREADRIDGGDDDDLIRGGAGSDELDGGRGDDTIYGGGGTDVIWGGAGDDLLQGQGGGDTIEGGAGNDEIFGGAGTNFLFGQGGRDHLVGGNGSDELFGGAGADVLSAGAGADFVLGGVGDDVLSANLAGGGDVAVDTFIFEGAFGDDVVSDFEIGFDGILLAVGITAADVTTSTRGDDVLISVDFLGTQTITLVGVADLFNAAIDIQIGG
jgi:Ca2+-binding RTX toxin-like protein